MKIVFLDGSDGKYYKTFSWWNKVLYSMRARHETFRDFYERIEDELGCKVVKDFNDVPPLISVEVPDETLSMLLLKFPP